MVQVTNTLQGMSPNHHAQVLIRDFGPSIKGKEASSKTHKTEAADACEHEFAMSFENRLHQGSVSVLAGTATTTTTTTTITTSNTLRLDLLLRKVYL